MFRYFAVCWNGASEAVCARARKLMAQLLAQSSSWQVVVDVPGLLVACAGATNTQRAYVLRGDGGRLCGVVLGDLFGGSTRCGDLSATAVERILATRGRELVTRYWGGYVALLHESQNQWVLRSPATTLPCLHVSLGDLDIYFSWTEACAALDCIPFSINWRAAAWALIGLFPSRETAINEIDEILPGFCAGPHGVQCYWNPLEIAREPQIGDFDAASTALRETTQHCVSAWAEGSSSVLHSLSGGLDSSIVLSCLRDAPTHPSLTCLTHFASGPDSDERPFARLAARSANCDLLEREQPADIDLHQVVHGIRFERSPGMRIPQIDRIEPDIAIDVGAQIVTRGHGGDELFCRHHTHFYIADYLRERGLRSGLLQLLMHSSVTEGEPLWSILAGAIRSALLPRRWDITQVFVEDQEGQSLLNRELFQQLLSHHSDEPYPCSTRDCPPGKLWQISLITGRRFHYLPSTREGDPRPISPLLSQPLIETCLRIPTYLQMKGRRERAVARAAFERLLPTEIIERRGKGGAEHSAWRLLRRNHKFVREFLLDGQLARAQIVDRPALEAALDSAPASKLKATVPIFHLIGAEAWVEAWSGR